MQRIIVENFGPIKNAEIDITNIVVLIGEQASGKSTLAKLVYFFMAIKNEIFEMDEIIHSHRFEESPYSPGGIRKKIQKTYYSFFGKDANPLSKIEFILNTNNSIIFEKDKLIDTKFLIEVIESASNEFFKTYNIITKGISFKGYFNLKIHLDELLNCYQKPLYVPASRNVTVSYGNLFGQALYGSLSQHIMMNDERGDFVNLILLQKFMNHCESLKDLFKDGSFLKMIDKEESNYGYLEKINTLSLNILHGKYVNNNNNEFINISDSVSISLDKCSTGQQESIRIIQDLFFWVHKDEPCFRVIEEPEAHLFPTAQKHLMEIVSLFINHTITKDEAHQNQVIITTHSPYVLAAFNNLLYAGQKAVKNDKISELLWLKKENVTVYKLHGGYATSIMDEELGLIKNEEIDEASRIINKEFDFIDNL